jgi:hypothetical protein
MLKARNKIENSSILLLVNPMPAWKLSGIFTKLPNTIPKIKATKTPLKAEGR